MILFLLFLTAVESPTQLLQRGLLALERGDLTQARGAFEAAIKTDPHNAYAWVSLAETDARQKRPLAASAAAANAEKFGAANPAVSHALAMYYSRNGELEHAAKLESVFAASPNADSAAGLRAAALFLSAGKTVEALPLAQEAILKHPSAEAENVLGRVLIAAGQTEQGLHHLDLAWESQKTDSRIAFDYAQALLRKEDFGQAAEVISSALESHPNDPQLELALGVARYGQRRFEDAINAFLKVIQIDPEVEQPYVFLGKMLDQAGDHLVEITAVDAQWLARNPRGPIAQLQLAKARLAADSKDATAESLLRKSTVSDRNNWEAHYELGVLLETKRDFQNAAAELRRSAQLDPKQPMPHYHLARVYDRLGDDGKAKAEREIHAQLTK